MDVVSNLPAFSTDILIFAALVLVALYGMIAGHAALIRESVSVYVGIVLAASFGKPLYDYIQQSAGGGLAVSESMIKLLLLLVPILLLQFGRKHGHDTGHHNIFVTLLLSILTAMLLVSSVIQQFDPVALSRITDQSNLASWIHDFYLVWLATVPIAIAVSAFFKPNLRGKHR